MSGLSVKEKYVVTLNDLYDCETLISAFPGLLAVCMFNFTAPTESCISFDQGSLISLYFALFELTVVFILVLAVEHQL